MVNSVRAEVGALTAFSRTGRTTPDRCARVRRPAARDLRFLDREALAGQVALIYGSKGREFAVRHHLVVFDAILLG
jgi:hypothetical protein